MHEKMAEAADTTPSVEGIFEILAQIPQDRLVRYEHTLNHVRKDRRIYRLLRTMVLLTLNQEAEARVSLDDLGYDLVAAHIYRSHGARAKAEPAAPEPDAEVALVVAQIYSFLADEKLCHPQARDEAYRVAVHVFQESHVDPARLKSLLDEAWEKCGLGFTATWPGKDLGASPAWPAERHPVPIHSSLEPCSLRSTGTPLSFVSHFEISPATTMACVTGSDREPDAEVVHGSTPADLGSDGEEGPGLGPLANYCPPAQDATLSHGSGGQSCLRSPDTSLRPGERGAQQPPHCTDPNAVKELPAPEGGLPPKPDTPSVARSGSPDPAGPSPKPTKGSPSPPTPKRETEPWNPPSSAFPPHSMESSPGDETQFFSFVVLHAGEDEAVACRVKSNLESLGVPDGATFSEDFLVPGRGQLDCFQEALDNSAFTLLLLTENFRGRFCDYQTSVALMDSFQRFFKSSSVIPFVPKENPIPAREMPTVLAGLVALDENSPVFGKRVKNTFTARAIREKKAAWRIHVKRRQQERHHAYQEALKRLEQLSTHGYPPERPAGLPGFQPPLGHFPQTLYSVPFLPPGVGQPATGPDHPSLSQPFLVSAGGLQPQLIIQNAQMIQIGDYNHMQAERGPPALGTPGGDAREG